MFGLRILPTKEKCHYNKYIECSSYPDCEGCINKRNYVLPTGKQPNEQAERGIKAAPPSKEVAGLKQKGNLQRAGVLIEYLDILQKYGTTDIDKLIRIETEIEKELEVISRSDN